MPGRTLAIGDVHGCSHALVTLLSAIGPKVNDQFIFVGDLVDRGPDSKGVLDAVLELQSKCQVLLIMGNHEELMRNAISGRGLLAPWYDAGGKSTIESYGGDLSLIPTNHIRLLMNARPYYESEAGIFIHASLESDLPMNIQTSDYLRWKHLGGSERPHFSGKRVICGHTPQKDGYPLAFPGWVCLDTYAHGGKWLTCLDVATNHVWQASQGNQLRDYSLEQCE